MHHVRQVTTREEAEETKAGVLQVTVEEEALEGEELKEGEEAQIHGVLLIMVAAPVVEQSSALHVEVHTMRMRVQINNGD